MPTHGNALVIMTKAPQAGQSKTRLVPPLSLDEAAGLATALLFDQLEHLARFSGANLFISFAPANAAQLFNPFQARGFACFAQQGDSLGERMNHAFTHLFASGFSPTVLIGSDLPPVPHEFLDRAYTSLQVGADVVLGPAADGGYYLIGMSRPLEDVFQNIRWSQGDVLARTIEKIATLGLRHELMPSWYDIDTAQDLARLQSENESKGPQMKNTFALLHQFRQRGKVNS
jgi:uncharacterized protein